MKTHTDKLILCLFGFALFGTTYSSTVLAASFRGLGFLPDGACSEARAVSADGMVVVGTACTQSGVQAFTWKAGNEMQAIPLPSGLTKTWGVDVSADGNIVLGQGRKSDSLPYGYEAFLWNNNSAHFDRIAYPQEGSNTYTTAMTADGEIVLGNIWMADTTQHLPYSWTIDGGIEPLNILYETDPVTDAETISPDRVVIVGSRLYDTSPFLKIIYSTQDEVLAFGAYSANATSADGSVVVGTLDNYQTQLFEAYRWSPDTGVTLLGTCLPRYHSRALDVSADGGLIVGYVQSDATDEQTAMIWDRQHGMRLLEDILQNNLGLDLTGWKLTRALAISADGSTIVGDGWNPQGSTEAWRANLTDAEHIVYFPDINLKAAAEQQLQIINPDTIDMLSLTWLDAGHLGITNITGLENALNITYLDLENNNITDVTPLTSLNLLENLDLDFNHIEDITPLTGLVALSELDLEANKIKDITPLSPMTQLTELDLEHNQISNISTLSNMSQLRELELQGNPLNTIAYCTNLPLILANNPDLILTIDPDPNPLTSDCLINATDLLQFADDWLRNHCDTDNNWCQGADTNHTGNVDLTDLAILAQFWLQTP